MKVIRHGKNVHEIQLEGKICRNSYVKRFALGQSKM